MQIEAIDDSLRNGLWNVVHLHYFSDSSNFLDSLSDKNEIFLKLIWKDFFKNRLDALPEWGPDVIDHIRNWFYGSAWYDVYDLVEFIAQIDAKLNGGKATTAFNRVLKEEVAGYRLLDGYVVQITEDSELAEIEDAIDSARRTALSGVDEHLSSALAMLADKKNPDYRNSIKESISAVESLAKIISGDPKAELGKALKMIDSTVGIHAALKRGFSAIYGYTSDEGGIRHAMLESATVDFEDAKYMLVSCSSFINYLIVKAGKAGISFRQDST
jgi:hypothetical protein